MLDRGSIRVADAHIHFFSYHFLELMSKQAELDVADAILRLPDWEIPPPDPEALADHWVDELDRCQVDRAALIASAPGDVMSVAAAIDRAPARFVGYFMYDPTRFVIGDTKALDAGLRCVALFPSLHGYDAADSRAHFIVDQVAKRPGTAVFVHCGLLSIGIRKKLGMKSDFDLEHSNPLAVQKLARRHPHLPFIIPHFGSGYFREALMVASSTPNIYLDTSSSNKWMAIEGLTLKQVFARALEVVGAERLLFGTDSSFFPRGWNETIFDAQLGVLKDLDVRKQDIDAIFHGNFQRIFHLG